VNDAALARPIDLMHALFGDPIDDADLFTSELDKETARCQKEMLERVNQLEDTVAKELVKAKKKAIKEPVVGDAPALEAVLAEVFSINEKIPKKEEKLLNRIDDQCTGLTDFPDTIFPGTCADASLAAVAECAIAAARCVACSKINAFDALALDCDWADNQAADGSCPLP
jgi:hypothetical protein